MPTWGGDTLPSQRVPQKILKKSISLEELNDTLHNKIVFPDKLHVHAIYKLMQFDEKL